MVLYGLTPGAPLKFQAAKVPGRQRSKCKAAPKKSSSATEATKFLQRV